MSNCSKCKNLILEPHTVYGINPPAVCRCATNTPKPQANTLDEILNKLELAIAGDDAIDCSKAHIGATQAITQAMLDMPELQDEYSGDSSDFQYDIRNELRAEIRTAIKKIGGE